VFINRVHIRIPGLHIPTFAVYRNPPDLTPVDSHSRDWCQLILYLSGLGRQTFTNGDIGVEPGTLVVFPPGLVHTFKSTTNRMPLCLMIEFDLKGARSNRPAVYKMNRSELIEVRQQLAYLLKLRSRARGVLRVESATVVLQLLITLLRVAGWLERVPEFVSGPGESAIHRLLYSVDVTTPLQQIVRRSGYQRDHLNRLVKKETGLSLGQVRMQRRLAKAKELLSDGIRVANVANEVGFTDQSYFSRWFRLQTGRVPSHWPRHGQAISSSV
jgi:AraC family transcriptional regulator, transcriptional activator of pobA